MIKKVTGLVAALVGLAIIAATPAAPAAASDGIITTIAGNGTPGYSGNDGLATAASLNSPTGLAVDGSGNIYIADKWNRRIRKITASTGVISTVAGNGTSSYSGDGGQATAAGLPFPEGVAVDGSGNLYIADRYSNRIRKITASTGVISTVAGNGTAGYSGDGGQATAASINGPKGVAVDSSENLYIVDTNNHRIRKVTASTGVISTVAGNGNYLYLGDGGQATAAGLHNPVGVAVDGSGNLYIADTSNNRIRKVAVSTGVISTVAGNGGGYYSGDGGQATAATLRLPSGVFVDGSGDIYLADTDNSRIRKVTASTGVISTVAGNVSTGDFSGDGSQATAAGISRPGGVSLDGSGNIYIADTYNNRIRKVTVATPTPDFTIAASPASVSVVQGASSATSTITTMISGGLNSVVALSAAGLPAGATATFSPTSIASPGSGGSTLTLSTTSATPAGSYTVMVTGTDGSLTRTSAITLTVASPEFTIAATPASVSAIQGADATSTLTTTVFGAFSSAVTFSATGLPLGATATFSPASIAAPGSGSSTLTLTTTSSTLTGSYLVTVTGTGGGITHTSTIDVTIRAASSSRVITTIAGDGTLSFSEDGGQATAAGLADPSGVAIDGSGNIYIADTSSNRIRKVSAESGVISTVAGSHSTDGYSGDGGDATEAILGNPEDVAVDGSGNIYIADTNNHRIRKVTASTGMISTVAGNGTGDYAGDGGDATAASLNSPLGVAVDGSGNIYIADMHNHRIRKVTASTGVISTVAGNGDSTYSGDGGQASAASLYWPRGVAIDGSGNIYIADNGNSRIRKVTASTGVISTVAGNGTEGYSGDDGQATSASFYTLKGVAVDGSGDIYIVDDWNHRIRKVTVSTGVISTFAGNGTGGYSGDGGQATEASLYHPGAVAIDGSGSIYIADRMNQRIRKVTAGTPAPDFTIAASPASLSVVHGASASSTINTSVTGSFSSVTLSATGLPTGATATFSPASIASPGAGSSTLTLATTLATPAGSYTVTLTGTGGGRTHATAIAFTVALPVPTLAITVTGTGGGAISSSPGGIACINGSSEDCIAPFTDSAVTLHATADSSSTFGGWSGDCLGTAPSCSISMTTNRSVSASFIAAPKVKIGDAAYSTLLAACTVAGNGTTILAREIEFPEDLIFGTGSNAILKGGFDAAFSANAGNYSTINGSLKIRKGCLTVDHLRIR